MAEWRDRINELMTRLEQERDELQLKMHLAKADARDELAKLDDKMVQLRERASRVDDEAKEAFGDISDAARKLAAEIKEGFERVRKQL
jgi:predicted  nucleic acid-binding Zn-ribbon protein